MQSPNDYAGLGLDEPELPRKERLQPVGALKLGLRRKGRAVLVERSVDKGPTPGVVRCELCDTAAGNATLIMSWHNRNTGRKGYRCQGGCRKQLADQFRRVRKQVEKGKRS